MREFSRPEKDHRPLKRLLPFTLRIPLPIECEQPLIEARIVMAMAVDQIPVRRASIQGIKKLFNGMRVEQDMAVQGQNGRQIVARDC